MIKLEMELISAKSTLKGVTLLAKVLLVTDVNEIQRMLILDVINNLENEVNDLSEKLITKLEEDLI